MIQVKTSAKCAGCVAKIAEQLNLKSATALIR